MVLSLLILYFTELLFALPNQFTTEYIVGTGIHGLPLLSTVQLTVRQQSQNLFGFTFVVNNPSKLLTAFVDGSPCYESCFYAKRNGENVSLAYEPNVYDFAVFQQADQQTLFFFEGCRVDVAYCQITQIKGGTFCACQNGNNCADAQQMKLCFTTIAPATSTTTLMKTTQPSTTLSSTSISSTATTQSTSTISSTPATSVTTTIASTTEVLTTTTSTITTTRSSTVSPTPSDCTTTDSSSSIVTSSSISTTQSSTTLQLRSTSSMQTSSISTAIQVSTTAEITTKVGTATIGKSTSSSRIPTTSKQTLQTTESPTDVLKNISDSGVSLQNVTQSLNTTLAYTEDPKDLSPDDIYYVANILTESANLTDLPEEDALLILQNIDNVLNANENVISESGSQQK